MFAVLRTGGKQYKVAQNDVIKVEKLSKDTVAQPGEIILLEEVLVYNDGKKTTIGAPTVKNISVSAEVIEQTKDDKVLIFKKKRRHNYRRKVGYRHNVVYLRIKEMGEGLTAKKAPAKAAKPAEKVEEKKAAPKKAATEAKKTTAKTAKTAKPAEKVEEKKAAPKKAATEAKKAPAKKPAAKKTTAKKAEDKK